MSITKTDHPTLLSVEHEELAATVRRFLESASGEAAVRRDMATDLGWELHTWRRIANELGLTTLMIPEEFGGAGFGLVEVGVAMEAAGRTLLCAPLLS
jgi:alkylation response protein AidB-like acyl-CoA dehydrogenase